MKYHRQLDKDDRLRLETLYNAGHSKKDIAARLHVHISTVYRELKRGRYDKLHWNLYIIPGYSADIAQRDHDFKAAAKGAPFKLGHNYALAETIEDMIINRRYSPGAAAAALRSRPEHGTLCEATIYRYIDMGVFSQLTREHLPERGIRKHPYKKVEHKNKTHLGTSIEERPQVVSDRSEFGHWEMDCVEGKQGTKGAFLVLTERLTRAELSFKLPHKTSKNVVKVLDRLQERCAFRKLFKSITIDNGSEFANSRRMEHSPRGRRRTYCYYCHPYTASERGSNEVANRLVRRWYPKGQPFTAVTGRDCRRLSAWMNQYPRELLGWKTASQAFTDACQAEGIKITPYLSQYLY